MAGKRGKRRPRCADGTSRLAGKVFLYLGASERARIDAAAQALGETVSGFARSATLARAHAFHRASKPDA